MTSVRHFTIALLAAALLPGCVSKPKPPTPPPGPRPAFTWSEEKAKAAGGAASIVVNLTEQRAYFYKGGEPIGDSKCSSGKKTFPTPPGEYKVIQKDAKHVSNLYGNFLNAEGGITKRDVDMSKMKVPEGETFAGAKMPYFMRFHGGYGMHAGNVPNHPASHGCVRLPRVAAETFFRHTPMGTPVSVIVDPPEVIAARAEAKRKWEEYAAQQKALAKVEPKKKKGS